MGMMLVSMLLFDSHWNDFDSSYQCQIGSLANRDVLMYSKYHKIRCCLLVHVQTNSVDVCLSALLLSFQFVDLGVVTSIEANHKQLETARKGQEVCIKIEPIPGETPKMFGRHFDEHDMLVSKVSKVARSGPIPVSILVVSLLMLGEFVWSP